MYKRTLVALALIIAGVARAGAAGPTTLTDADVYASVNARAITLRNAVVERRWEPDVLVTTALVDKRPGGVALGEHPDFSLLIDVLSVSSDRFAIRDVTLSKLARGGIGVTFDLSLAGLVSMKRIVEAYPGVAGFSSRTTVTPLVPLVVSGYTLDGVATGAATTPTIHAFRAGADWRFDEGWNPVAIGDSHPGDWHVTASAAPGQELTAPGEWLSAKAADARTVFMVM
ncbi:MAG: hypothetical protein ACRDKS_07130, partial [Actinomycetota bacterium]